jgi:hypothetical protein
MTTTSNSNVIEAFEQYMQARADQRLLTVRDKLWDAFESGWVGAARSPVMPGGPWQLRWYGSGDDRGDHIFCEGERIAYLGDQHHDAASRIVYDHNVGIGRRKCELCLGAGVAMAKVQFTDGTCSQQSRPCPLCTPEREAQTTPA